MYGMGRVDDYIVYAWVDGSSLWGESKEEEKLSQNIAQAQKWLWPQSIPMDRRVIK